jgi:hypothetical protein
MEKIYVLAINAWGKGWDVLAVFDKKPTFNMIMALDGFIINKKIGNQIAEKIAEHGCCRINYNENLFDWIEYKIFEKRTNELFNLHEYLITGYGDMDEKLCINYF